MTRLIMGLLVILVAVGVVLATTGVLRFRNTKEETGVTIDKKELKEKAQQAVEKTEQAGSKILEKTGKTLQKAAERMRGSSGERHEPTTIPPAADDSRNHADLSPPHPATEPGGAILTPRGEVEVGERKAPDRR